MATNIGRRSFLRNSGPKARTKIAMLRPSVLSPQSSVLSPRALRALWRILWFPFWFGTDLRPPALPRRGMADNRLTVLRRGLEATRFVQWMLEIQDRIWRQRLLLIALRAFWLSALVAILVCLVAIAKGTQPATAAIAVPAGIITALAFVYAWLQRPTRMGIARFLDQGYALDATLATSLELAQGEMDSHLAPHLLNHAARTAYRIGRTKRLRLHRIVQEQVMALGLAIVTLGVVLLLLISNTLNHHTFAPVPKLPDVKQQQQQNGTDANGNPTPLADQQLTPEQLQQLAVQSAQAQQDLQRLANSLSDNSTTKQAAQDIQNGNYSAAAQDLQQVASNLNQTSPDAQQNIASDLQQAANQNTPGNQPLTDAEKNAAQALTQGNSNDASQSVRNLANQVQQTGGQVQSQQDLSTAIQDAQQRANGDQQGQQGQQGQPGPQGQQGQQDSNGKPQNASGQNPSNQNGPGAGLGQPIPYQPGDPAQAQNLGNAGNPLPLTGQPNGQSQPLPGGTGNPQSLGNSPGGGNSAPQSGQQGNVDPASPDANRVPRDRRDVVQGYFTQPGP
ncbi:MAG: hypothetical protein ACR2M3_20585 [Thermomicrobiales bacterium]